MVPVSVLILKTTNMPLFWINLGDINVSDG